MIHNYMGSDRPVLLESASFGIYSPFRDPYTMSLRHIALSLLFCMMAGPALAGDFEDIQQLLKAHQYKSVVDRADSYLAKNPKDAQIRFLRAIALTELGRNDEAIKAFTSLTEDYPQLPEPYNNLAVLYAQQNQLDKARTALMMAIQTNPSYAIAHENLGDLYARMASQAYDKALQLEGSNQNVQSKLTLVRELFSSNPAIAPHATPAATSGTKVAQNTPAKATPVPTPVATPRPTPTPAPTPTPKPTATPTSAPTPAPTPAPEKASAPRNAEQDDVIAAVNAWASAWSHQNVNGYLAAYSRNFKTPSGTSYTDWAKERRERIASPKSIEVSVSNIKIDFTNNDTARVKFRQSYKSDRLSARSTGKTLILEKSGGRWLIVEERT